MLKNIIKVLFSNVILVALSLIRSLIFPILLNVDDYAYYQEYLLYVSYVNICHLGIASGMFLNYAGKKYADIDKKQYKNEIYLIYIVLLFLAALGLLWSGVSKNVLVVYVSLTIIPQCLIASFQALYQAWERFTAYSVVNLLPRLLFGLLR